MTTSPTINDASKSQLAKLLAVENISVQHSPAASTASFDVKNRVLTLPVWQNISADLYDMLVVHEVGHALDTPGDGWIDTIDKIAAKTGGNRGIIKDYLNVIEDARIDKRQKRRFPGARRNYVFGYRELIERDFFGTANRDINRLPFIDRANMYFKGGALLGIKFTDDEQSFIDEMAESETFEEVIDLTEKIYAWAKENQQKMQDQQETEGAGAADDGDEEGDGFTANPNASDGGDEPETETDGEGDEQSDGSDGDADDEDGEGDQKSSSDGFDDRTNANQFSDDAPASVTEQAWQEKQSDIVKSENLDYVYVGIPKPDLTKIVDDYKVVLAEQTDAIAKSYMTDEWKSTLRKELQRFLSDENSSISFMVKEFEMKKAADLHKRTSIAKTGTIDTNKLFKFKYSDDIFLRQAVESTGKNHGIVLIMDWSGSMQHNLKKTVKQLISLTMFCKRVQIPFEVYIFRDTDMKVNAWSYQPKDMLLEDFKLRNILSSRMSLAQFNEALFNLWFASYSWIASDRMYGTPLNEAIVAASYVVNQFRAKSKVQIVNTIFLTDGGAGAPSVYQPTSEWSPRRKKYIIQDSVTKKTYATDNSSSSRMGARETTAALLQNFKDRTGSNLIGFYIYESSNFQKVSRDTMIKLADNTDPAFWRNNGYAPAVDSGYDEYYILNPNNLNIQASSLDVNDKMTATKIAKEFSKFSTKKSVNRVLLSNFISKIAA